MLTDRERRILTPLFKGPQDISKRGEEHLADLAARGYVRLLPSRCGPLGTPTGEKMVVLTEAAREAERFKTAGDDLSRLLDEAHAETGRYRRLLAACEEERDQLRAEIARLQATAEEKAPEEATVRPLPPDGVTLIAEERRRQMAVEGWTPAHDDEHDEGQMAAAAACYAMAPDRIYFRDGTEMREVWPWDPAWDKRDKHPPLRRLVISGALVAAEIDRLLRVGVTPASPPPTAKGPYVPPRAEGIGSVTVEVEVAGEQNAELTEAQ